MKLTPASLALIASPVAAKGPPEPKGPFLRPVRHFSASILTDDGNRGERDRRQA